MQLGIIGQARPLQRVRPAMVEYIFALAVHFGVKRGGGDGLAVCIFDPDMARRPTCLRARTAGRFQRVEKTIAEKRVLARREQRVPIRI